MSVMQRRERANQKKRHPLLGSEGSVWPARGGGDIGSQPANYSPDGPTISPGHDMGIGDPDCRGVGVANCLFSHGLVMRCVVGGTQLRNARRHHRSLTRSLPGNKKIHLTIWARKPRCATLLHAASCCPHDRRRRKAAGGQNGITK